MLEETQPQLSSAGATPPLPPELWFKIMFQSSSTLSSYQNLQLANGPSFKKMMQTEFARRLISNDQTQNLAENIFYSRNRDEIFLGQLICDTETDVISTALPNYDRNLRCIHTEYNSFYITRDNLAYGCGDNLSGELGLGHTNKVKTPTLINTFPEYNDIKTIAVDKRTSHTFFITHKGRVYVCGSGHLTYLEDLVGVNSSNIPIRINIPDNAIIEKIEAFRSHLFFITNRGEVYACGYNGDGILGLGHENTVPHPTKISALQGFRVEKIVSGISYTFFITDKGEVFTCGRNSDGNLGLGDTDDVFTPTRVAVLNGKAIKDICISNEILSFFIGKENGVWACGKNDDAQLGLGHTQNVFTPQPIPTLKNVAIKQIVIANEIIFFLTYKGQVLTNHQTGLAVLKALQGETVVKIQHLHTFHKDYLAFITLGGKIIELCLEKAVRYISPALIDESSFTTIANFHSFLPEAMIAPIELKLAIARLQLNRPVGWLWDANHYTDSFEQACKLDKATNPTPAFMTQWLLSYPMKELKNTLNRNYITSQETKAAGDKCNMQFSKLLNIIDKNCQTQPLLLEHTQKSITPEVMELALAYLNTENIRRLASYASVSQTQRWLNFTAKARQQYEIKNLRSGWNSLRADKVKPILALHKALLEHQRANAQQARTP